METLKGYVSGVVYRNEENAYTVFEITTQDGTVPCTGFPAAIAEGESCILTGQFTTHPIYGKQFQMKTYTVCEPEGTQAVFRYLSSGAVKGIGAALAGRIIAAFGDDTMRILDEEPERLAEVKGISERKAREIAAAMEGKKDLRDAMIFLQKYGIGGRTAVRIWQSYG
ncbi:MAG: ATP-dependent RecD-like DNA helicase, partial [Lachnospiraceae bacterium]|nr:ATP-dependent RecD-like DNA helicase [Lachnospiraceae bacterium]